jgi:hypothetical protein
MDGAAVAVAVYGVAVAGAVLGRADGVASALGAAEALSATKSAAGTHVAATTRMPTVSGPKRGRGIAGRVRTVMLRSGEDDVSISTHAAASLLQVTPSESSPERCWRGTTTGRRYPTADRSA